MPAQIITAPRPHVLSKDDNWVTLSTEKYAAENVNRFIIEVVDGTDPVAGSSLDLGWGNESVELSFAVSPDNSGLQISTRESGESADDYRERLAGELRSVYEISRDFVVSISGNNIYLTLLYTEPLILSLFADRINASFVNAVDADQYPNLAATLHLYKVGEEEAIVKLRASYNATRSAAFNLADTLGLEISLPDTSRLRSYVPELDGYAPQSPEGSAQYYFRYADLYGRPVRAERLRSSAIFSAVAGGSAGDAPMRWMKDRTYQMCHAYLTNTDQQFVKPISPEQPDWLYLYVGDVGEAYNDKTLTPYVDIVYADGTSETMQVPGSTATPAPDRSYWCFPSGPYQAGLQNAPSWTTKTAVRYTFRVEATYTGTVAAIAYKLLPDCHPWEVFLAYTNGAGGIETIAMRGKSERSYQATRQRFRRARTQVQSAARGEFLTYDEEGQQQIRLRSGWLPKEYAEHLKQLMLADVWIVDVQRTQFVSVLVNDSSLTLTQDDDDLHAIELTVTTATPDRNAHRL